MMKQELINHKNKEKILVKTQTLVGIFLKFKMIDYFKKVKVDQIIINYLNNHLSKIIIIMMIVQ